MLPSTHIILTTATRFRHLVVRTHRDVRERAGVVTTVHGEASVARIGRSEEILPHAVSRPTRFGAELRTAVALGLLNEDRSISLRLVRCGTRARLGYSVENLSNAQGADA